MPSSVPPTHAPLGRPSTRTVAPLAALAALALVVGATPPYSLGGWPVLAGAVLGLVVVGLVALAARRPRRTWVDSLAGWLCYPSIMLLMAGTGGATSGLIPLLAVPLVWLALYGTFADLIVAAALTALTQGLPLLVLGAPLYDTGDWRRATLWTAVVLLVGPVVQSLVRRLAASNRRASDSAALAHGLLRGAHLSSIVATDPDGRITSFGVGAERLLGWSEEQMRGQPLAWLFHDPDELVARARELGVSEGFDVLAETAHLSRPSAIWTYVCASGERRSVRLAVTEIRDDDGLLAGFLHVAIDATTDMANRAALQASEARWRVAMDSLPDTTVLVIDDAHRIHLSSGGGAMRVGMGDVVGKRLEEVSKPANVALVSGLLEQAWRGEVARADVNATATGAEHEVVVHPLPTGAGESRQGVILARDVSRDRARQREIAAARDRAERLFSDSPHGIALVGRDGVVARANAALVALVGRDEDEVVGRGVATWGEDGDDTAARHLDDVLHGPSGRSRTDWSLRATAGDELHVALSSTLLDAVGDGPEEVLVTVTDISERRRHEQQLAHLADHDPLTGLANRRRFNAELDRHLEFCGRYGPRGAVLLLDLDHFKEVNDTLGHSAGDQLIVSVASIIRRTVRSTDVVARLGGDEFAVLLLETGRAGAETVAESIAVGIREHVATLDGSTRQVTASVGVVLVDHVTTSSGPLMVEADEMMYDAKDAGRDRWRLLDRASLDQPRGDGRLHWDARLERALARDELALHLQPVHDARTGRLVGAEALLRLVDGPEPVLPASFLYVAERTDLITRIDAWVVDRAVALLAELQRHDPDFRVEVNLSRRSAASQRVETAVRESLEHHGADPGGLVLEVSETVAVADVAAVRGLAERLHVLGCRFAIDDFGAGLGSLYHLKHLVFDYLKIDGEFITTCDTSPADRAVLTSIVGVAHDLGTQTVAEHVAGQGVLDVVREHGVDLVQGYHLGRPEPAAAFVARVVDHLPGRDAASPVQERAGSGAPTVLTP